MPARALWGCLALACASLAGGQITKTDGGYLLRAKYKPGTTSHYESLVSTQGYNVKTDVTVKVLSVKKGIATVQISQGPALGGSQNVPLASARTNTLKLDRQNRVIGSSTSAELMAQFPAKPVKPGSVWGGVSTFSFGKAAGAALETDYQFAGVKKDRGKRLAMLDVQVKGFASGTGTLLVDCDDGSLLVSILNLKIRTSPTDSSTVQLQIRRSDIGGHRR